MWSVKYAWHFHLQLLILPVSTNGKHNETHICDMKPSTWTTLMEADRRKVAVNMWQVQLVYELKQFVILINVDHINGPELYLNWSILWYWSMWTTSMEADTGEGTVALYATPNPFLLNKICLNQWNLIWGKWLSTSNRSKLYTNWGNFWYWSTLPMVFYNRSKFYTNWSNFWYWSTLPMLFYSNMCEPCTFVKQRNPQVSETPDEQPVDWNLISGKWQSNHSTCWN